MARKSLSRSHATLVGAVLLGALALPAVAQAGRPLERPALGIKGQAAQEVISNAAGIALLLCFEGRDHMVTGEELPPKFVRPQARIR